MKNIETLQKDVVDELAWDPQVDSSDIAVTAHDGMVTLSGHTTSFGEKLAAEKAARRVRGVKAVVDNIEVRMFKPKLGDDERLATDAMTALRWNHVVPADDIQLVVQDGWIKLSGNVTWFYQKNAAEKAVRYLRGVKGVMNNITITPTVATADVVEQIGAAFKRNAAIDAGQVKVHADGSRVTLTGSVRSWSERRAAEHAAWKAPGVTQVVNDLLVDVPVSVF